MSRNKRVTHHYNDKPLNKYNNEELIAIILEQDSTITAMRSELTKRRRDEVKDLAKKPEPGSLTSN